MSATLIAQVISFFIMPVITRMHTPESLGEYQYFTTLALVLLPFVSGKFDFAIKSASSRIEALKALRLAVAYTLVCSLLLILILLIVGMFLLNSKLGWLVPYLPVLVLFIFLSANFQFAMAVLTNEQRYGLQSTFTITKSSISNFLKLALSYYSSTGFSLVFSLVITEVFQLLRILGSRPLVSVIKIYQFQWRHLKKTFSRLRAYPTYVTFTAVMAILMNWFPILVTGYFYGSTYTGLLGLAFMVVNTPVYPFISAMTTICFGDLARSRAKRKMLHVYTKVFLLSLIPAMVGLLVLGLWSKELFVFVFGDKWAEAGPIAFICFIPISISLLLSPIYSTLNHFFSYQKVFFKINLFFVIVGLGLTGCVAYLEVEFQYFLFVFAGVMSLSHLSLFVISLLMLKHRRVF